MKEEDGKVELGVEWGWEEVGWGWEGGGEDGGGWKASYTVQVSLVNVVQNLLKVLLYESVSLGAPG